MRTARGRHVMSGAMIGLTYLAAVLATLPLVLILTHLIAKGAWTGVYLGHAGSGTWTASKVL